MDIDFKDDGFKKICKVKKQVCKVDFFILVGIVFFFDFVCQIFVEQEVVMVMEDKFVVDIEEKKNEFEVYIYDFCVKFDEQYVDFVSEEEKVIIKVKFEVIEVRIFYC